MTEIRLEKSLPSEQERVGQPSVQLRARATASPGRASILCRTRLKRIAVPPGLSGSGVEKQDFEATLEPLLAEPRAGKTVAYIHVPFCETHCLYCGFYNKAYREDESRIYRRSIQNCAWPEALPDRMPGRSCRVHGRRHAHGAAGGRSPAHLEGSPRCAAARQRLRDHGGRASVEFRHGQDGSVLRGRGKPLFARGAGTMQRSGRRWAACPIATR